MDKIAKIAVSAATYSIDKPYDYVVPENLYEFVKVGVRVLLPFGRGNRINEGMVLSVYEGERSAKLKNISTVLDDEPVIDEDGIRLALWICSRYYCTFYDAAKIILPIGLWYKIRTVYTLCDGYTTETALEQTQEISGAEAMLKTIEALGGKAEGGQLKAACGEKTSKLISQLCSRDILKMESIAMRQVKDGKVKIVDLAIPAEEAMEAISHKKKSAPLQYEAVKLLCASGSISSSELCYYTGASLQTLKALEKNGFVTMRDEEKLRIEAAKPVEPGAPIVLNSEQEQTFVGISELIRKDAPNAALLYGVTGSGKTQVYIRLIQEILKNGKTAIMLVPEIVLTPQMMNKFTAYFGDDVAMLHSGLKMTERYDQWKRIKRGDVKVVLGTRSAIFAPLKNIGLIVMDEEQEGSYQSENPPRYHAREVAKYLCSEHNATLLMGSATPTIESMYFSKLGNYHHFELRARYNKRAMPKVIIADMKDELRAGNSGDISRLLKIELQKNIDSGEQSILFINRRGNSRMVVCGECGLVPECPRCSVPLTYHSANNRMMCHYCGFSQPCEKRCPNCNGYIKHVGTGTQKVEEELNRLFPDTQILRMDADTVSAKMGHEKILNKFEKENIPILLGTQMVTKGLDFENVTLVGVLAADLSLYVDNYRAAERTFSLLTQVVGRAGRGIKSGRAVIQTYTPENEVITSAAEQNYDHFYESEIKMRGIRHNPPYCDIFTFVVSGLEESRVLRASSLLRDGMMCGAKSIPDMQIIGPAPAPILKINNRYRYRLYLMAKNTKAVRSFISYYIKAFHAEKENRGLNVFVDCNAID